MDPFQILVIVLSVLLAIFLVLGIVLTIIIIKITREIKAVATGARVTAERFAATATNVSNITDAAYVGKFVAKFIDKIKK